MRFTSIAKLTVLLALVLFFTPFIMVSCSDMGIEEEYTGMQLITRSAEDSPFEGMEEMEKYDNYKSNYWLIGAFALGVVTLVVLFLKHASLLATITSLAATILLVVFRLTFVSFYKLEEVEKFIVIKTKWGYIACLLCMGLTAVLSFIEYRKEDRFY